MVAETRLVVVQRRGAAFEAEHLVHVHGVDFEGPVRVSVGEDLVTTWRSAAKPFQLEVALGLLPDGGRDLSPEALALGTSSHHGEPGHMEVVSGLLGSFGLSESSLWCGTHPPLHDSSAELLVRGGIRFSPIHNNCSGKHAFMAAVCRAHGWPEDYRDPSHPLQSLILESVHRRSGGAVVDRVIDGCGVPCFVLPLSGMARAWASLAAAVGADDGQLGRVGRAMLARPWHMSGTSALDGEWMRSVRRPLIAKVGAEGLLCVALPEVGVGLALKVHSGASAARTVALRAVLERWFPEWLSPESPGSSVPIRNCMGADCGTLSAEWRP
jgi:L-asparaginase II